MNKPDKTRLKALAMRQLEIANSPLNKQKVALWQQHNTFKGEFPLIHIEVATFKEEAIHPFMQCSDPEARELEFMLLHNIANPELFNDDKPVADFFPVYTSCECVLFGHNISRTRANDSTGKSVGHQFEHIIKDLHKDFEKLMQPSVFKTNKQKTDKIWELASDIFGDILPVKRCMSSLNVSPTQKIVHWMGMQPMFLAMYDYPDEFKQMMDKIADDYLAYFKFLENEHMLLPTVGFERLNQGSFCFTDELPCVSVDSTEQVWGYMDSQETVGISPYMFEEFVFPCYKKIAGAFGLLSYGCCEPVHPIWHLISNLDNLRKVSVSPWCDQNLIAQNLRGKKIIFQRKPSPNYLGVGTSLDELSFRDHIETTVKAAAGCHLEITQRDVYTVNNDMQKVRRYVEIIRETIDKYWQP